MSNKVTMNSEAKRNRKNRRNIRKYLGKKERERVKGKKRFITNDVTVVGNSKGWRKHQRIMDLQRSTHIQHCAVPFSLCNSAYRRVRCMLQQFSARTHTYTLHSITNTRYLLSLSYLTEFASYSAACWLFSFILVSYIAYSMVARSLYYSLTII